MTADARGAGILTTHCPCCIRTCLINIFLPLKCQLNATHSINEAARVSAVSRMISQPRYSVRDPPLLSAHLTVWLRFLTSNIHL